MSRTRDLLVFLFQPLLAVVELQRQHEVSEWGNREIALQHRVEIARVPDIL